MATHPPLPIPHFTHLDAEAVYSLASRAGVQGDAYRELGSKTGEALRVIERSLDRYGLEHVALSFNGGKDCTLLVHLLAAVIYRRYPHLISSEGSSHPQTILSGPASVQDASTSTPSGNGSSNPSPNKLDTSSHIASQPTTSTSTSSTTTTTTTQPPPTPTRRTTKPIKSLYILHPSPFPQVEAFVAICEERYGLELVRVDTEDPEDPTPPPTSPPFEAGQGGVTDANANGSGSGKVKGVERFKEGIQRALGILGRDGREKVEAVLVGTRRSDPNGGVLTTFSPTDPGWPAFMRVHPVLDWTYKDVWDFLRCPILSPDHNQPPPTSKDGTNGPVTTTTRVGHTESECGVGWCELYDYGYTSLGSTHNTYPNPLLRCHVSHPDFAKYPSGWRPAWELEDESAERAGRETGK